MGSVMVAAGPHYMAILLGTCIKNGLLSVVETPDKCAPNLSHSEGWWLRLPYKTSVCHLDFRLRSFCTVEARCWTSVHCMCVSLSLKFCVCLEWMYRKGRSPPLWLFIGFKRFRSHALQQTFATTTQDAEPGKPRMEGQRWKRAG